MIHGQPSRTILSMCIRRESPGYINLNRKQNKKNSQTVSAFFFFSCKSFSKLSFVPCCADHKQVLYEYQESGINGKKRGKSCSDIELHNVSIERVQIFNQKDPVLLCNGVLTRTTTG